MSGLSQPPQWLLQDIRNLYQAAWDGGYVEFKDWVIRMTALLTEYPHLTASETHCFVLVEGPTFRKYPCSDQLWGLEFARRHADAGAPGAFDRYVVHVIKFLIEYPHLSPYKLNRLRNKWLARVGASVAPGSSGA